MNYKCSCCGGTSFKSSSLNKVLFSIQGDAWINSSAGVDVCLNCGHLEFFNYNYAKQYQDKINTNNLIDKQIEEKNKRINELKNQSFDPEPFKKEIEKLENEIKTLESLGVSGKNVESRQDCIKENKLIIQKEIDPKLENEINNLENEINLLYSQKVRIDD